MRIVVFLAISILAALLSLGVWLSAQDGVVGPPAVTTIKQWPPWFINSGGATPLGVPMRLEVCGDPHGGHTLVAVAWVVGGTKTTLLVGLPNLPGKPVNGGLLIPREPWLTFPKTASGYGVVEWAIPLGANPTTDLAFQVGVRSTMDKVTYLSNAVLFDKESVPP